MQALQQQPFTASRIAKPAAWRLALAPPPEPATDEPRQHTRLISAGVSSLSGLEDVAVQALDSATRGRWERAEVHEHDAPELNIILPTTTLTCEVVLGDERHEVEGPASIVVPAGLRHSIAVRAGTGFLVSVALDPQ
jgi:hypothetical protein